MTKFGYTMMCEQTGPRQLVTVTAAEDAGFDFAVIGRRVVAARQHPPCMFAEAVEIITRLFAGGYVNYRGDYFEVDSAKLWDCPEPAPPIGIAVSGPQSCELAGRYADMMIAVEPEAALGEMFDRAGGRGKPRVG